MQLCLILPPNGTQWPLKWVAVSYVYENVQHACSSKLDPILVLMDFYRSSVRSESAPGKACNHMRQTKLHLNNPCLQLTEVQRWTSVLDIVNNVKYLIYLDTITTTSPFDGTLSLFNRASLSEIAIVCWANSWSAVQKVTIKHDWPHLSSK